MSASVNLATAAAAATSWMVLALFSLARNSRILGSSYDWAVAAGGKARRTIAADKTSAPIEKPEIRLMPSTFLGAT